MKKNSKSILLEKAENDFIAVQNLLKQDSEQASLLRKIIFEILSISK